MTGASELRDGRWFALDRLTLAIATAIALLVMLAIVAPGPVRAGYRDGLLQTDFRAFYCGTRVVLERQNPYLAAPLSACQQHETDVPPGADVPIDPAPLPAYAFALMIPFVLAPFGVAALGWTALSLAAAIAGARMLALAARVPFAVGFASVLVIEGYRSIVYGQLSPIVVCALCAGAYLLDRGRAAAAAIALSITMIEPHLGLPACLAAFAFVPRTRAAFAVAAAVLAVAAIVAIGPLANLGYFTQTLPVHQLSEVGEPIQYSLTFVLYALGVRDPAALRIGSLEYFAAIVAGLVLAPRIARTLGTSAAIALFPVALAMLGGPFVHLFEIAGAVPFAVLVLGRAPSLRPYAVAAILLLALEWPMPHYLRTNVLEAATIVIVVAYATIGRTVTTRAAAVAGTLVAYVALSLAIGHVPASPLAVRGTIPAAELQRLDRSLASTQIALYRASASSWRAVSPRLFAGKIPTWLGLGLLLALGIRLAVTAPLPRSSRPERAAAA